MKLLLLLFWLEMLQVFPAAGRPVQKFLAQADSTEVYKVYYYVNHAELDVNFMHNAMTLREIDALVDSLLTAGSALSVHLVSGASPEGTEEGGERDCPLRPLRDGSFWCMPFRAFCFKPDSAVFSGSAWCRSRRRHR